MWPGKTKWKIKLKGGIVVAWGKGRAEQKGRIMKKVVFFYIFI